MTVRVRFAPSPTGSLHIGGARTALFNFLYAKHTGGKFLLRIEDTDKERSTEESAQGVVSGLNWLDIISDEPIVYQSNNLARHQAVANELIQKGAAYYCYTSCEELQTIREEQEKVGKSYKFHSPWRDTNKIPPADVKPVVRLKMPQTGSTEIDDLIQGKVVVENAQLDDMVLLRADGTPTYMLAAVVDDHDMKISHIIRGDEHFNNAFRQYHIFKAMNWSIPTFAHIPLIHGKDGTKLSKRHGAVGLIYYKDQGYLPEALNNYLLRLGWGHGDEEIISRTHAIEWFDIKDVKKSPARLDFDKLLNLNAHYIKTKSNEELVGVMKGQFEEVASLNKEKLMILERGIEGLKVRAKTINELFEKSKFYVADEPISITQDAQNAIDALDVRLLKDLCLVLRDLKASEWDSNNLKAVIEKFIKEHNADMKQIMQAIRALLAGSLIAPGIYDMMTSLGKEKSLLRLGQLNE